MANGLITSVRGRSAGGLGRITRVRGTANSLGQTFITHVRGRSGGPVLPVTAGADVLLAEPFTVANLAASGPNEDDVITWVWTQTAGPTVTLVGTGATRQYITPGTRTGTTLTFQVDATFADSSTSSDTVTHTIRAHGGPWMYVGSVLTAVGVNPPTL